jgi:hypothetical protein
MVWTGGALKVKGKVVDSICSQNDLVATLLAQLRKSNPAYQWSKKYISTKLSTIGILCIQ